jgi:hypothetical protein
MRADLARRRSCHRARDRDAPDIAFECLVLDESELAGDQLRLIVADALVVVHRPQHDSLGSPLLRVFFFLRVARFGIVRALCGRLGCFRRRPFTRVCLTIGVARGNVRLVRVDSLVPENRSPFGGARARRLLGLLRGALRPRIAAPRTGGQSEAGESDSDREASRERVAATHGPAPARG